MFTWHENDNAAAAAQSLADAVAAALQSTLDEKGRAVLADCVFRSALAQGFGLEQRRYHLGGRTHRADGSSRQQYRFGARIPVEKQGIGSQMDSYGGRRQA